ncbi:MAG: hypothetical protein KY394_06505 [Actinobacteria bacterium]|nr:hypothetical protein [Actinomycetota bacterium]
MSAVAERTEDHEDERSSRMGRAITRGIIVAMPVCVIGLTLAIWVLTDQGLMDSFVTAILPGTALGGFAGGFAGLAASMD